MVKRLGCEEERWWERLKKKEKKRKEINIKSIDSSISCSIGNCVMSSISSGSSSRDDCSGSTN